MSGTGRSDRTAALHAPVPPGESREVRIHAAYLSDPGLVRKNNEDACLLADLAPGGDRLPSGIETAVGPKGVLLAVSDGMGGQEAGEVASALAVDSVLQVLRAEWSAREERDDRAELRNDLRLAVDRANLAVLGHVEENPDREGMGATLTAAVVFGPTLLLAHVGDSRCYLLRGGYLKALTADQSLAEELVRRGIVQRDSEAYAARRSVLTRVVGQKGRLDPDSEYVQLARGDRILVCSDGLFGPVEEEAIREILSGSPGPEEAARALVEAARAAGAPDNVTCVVGWLSGPGLPDPSSLDAGGGTESISVDPEILAAAGDATLALAEARRDATGEFPAEAVDDDDTLAGTLGAAVSGGGPGGEDDTGAMEATGTGEEEAPGPGAAEAPTPVPGPSPRPGPPPPPPHPGGTPRTPSPAPVPGSGADPGPAPFPVVPVAVAVVIVVVAAVLIVAFL